MAAALDLIFSYQFKHNIWKIHAFEESPLLVLEIRDQDEMQVYFYVLDDSGKIITKNITLEESWWVSVAQIIDREVIFYTFDADNNPEIKEFIIYDLNNGQVNTRDKNFILSDYLKSSGKSQNNYVDIPFHYPGGSDYFNTVSTFIKDKFNDISVRGIDYSEKGDLIFISYFKESGSYLLNRLVALDKEQELVLDEKLGEFEKGITDNTFFFFNNKLIFVKGVSEFFIYQL